MSWDQQAYSFGNPNAQPLTPTRTPTSGQFPSPTAFQTPKRGSNLESRGGWTPTFAEEYSVFNATPGRLTSSQYQFAEASPRPSTSSTQKGISAGDLAAELITHVHHLSPKTHLPLPPVDPSNQLSSSPGPPPATEGRSDDSVNTLVTPRKPRKRLEGAFSAQTATPPATRSRGLRKQAPKTRSDTMQNASQDSHYGASHTPTRQQSHMSFPSSSADFFYPMSAPAFINSKPFWEPDASMGGMDLDFNTEDAVMFNMGSHRTGNSFDWGRNNQMVNVPAPTPSTVKRQRPLAPKLPKSTPELLPSTIASFDFPDFSASEDPFSPSAIGGVNPGLLFSRNNLVPMASQFADIPLPPTRPATSHAEQPQPYQHQLRESMRDQEELRRSRSRSSRESSKARRLERGPASSPVKGSARPSLQRSSSESRGKRCQPDRILSRSSSSSSGRISPMKHQRPSNLTSIPEMERPKTRTEVKFTIDANGRARTETVILQEYPTTSRGPSARSDIWESSQYDESSSDDESILVASRNTSFALPQQAKSAKMSGFDLPQSLEYQKHSSGGYSHSESSSQRSLRQDSAGSESGTAFMEEDDGSGDAAQALRKIMESRKKEQRIMRQSQQLHHRHYDTTPRGNSQYRNYGSSNFSPTSMTDPNAGTPSSSKSGTIRCTCGNPDSEGLMIQWYAAFYTRDVMELTFAVNLAITGFTPIVLALILGISLLFISALSALRLLNYEEAGLETPPKELAAWEAARHHWHINLSSRSGEGYLILSSSNGIPYTVKGFQQKSNSSCRLLAKDHPQVSILEQQFSGYVMRIMCKRRQHGHHQCHTFPLCPDTLPE
ncbi:PHD-finger domain-containing protein [Drepanopeziza brunnea f. sp. 'multigermtubi' MB_m1]|uniref:PHD-finger domain-containing protein n=1 Tax=Marssonina brunnea f. sp. multigermtubi (strain MB_m1) TaxID=1072389 RepID=K1XKT5_MARBU|nr:PHD-finger domain-containing protein [Drepanopeziza brunnea f. sp. 'multigermtubi' MB_m1]EKD13069.1 PHD-finger domain-containing protein [Drepanopeziza brunnea f. sp. 'multigermtubi' MB_m1]